MPWQPWVSLMPGIDAERHAVVGQWQKSPAGLRCAAQAGARIALPSRVEGEYDFRVRFTRNGGAHSVALIFPVAGRQAVFDIDGWGQHLAGIQQIRGRDMRAYRDDVASVTLLNGRPYTAVVEVRKNEVRAYLDGKLLHSHRTTGADLSLPDLWKLPDTQSLGLGAWDATTTFHSIEIRQSAQQSYQLPDRVAGPDDLAVLSDEFGDTATQGNWLRVFDVERTGADQLERFDIDRTQKGWMTLTPYTSTWYRDYRGALVHKRVRGDFVATTRVHTSGRSGRGAPASQFSLAGIMVRTPRDVTPQTWRPGGENYIFLSHGAANRPGNYQFEVKTTSASDSNLEISETRHAETEIRIARLGSHFILLRREPGGRWQVHRRYQRPDMPADMQVGMTVYSDYENASRLDPARHNVTVIRGGNPDLVARFDYFRFRRPDVPASLRGREFSNVAQVQDADLLGFLGEVLDGRP